MTKIKLIIIYLDQLAGNALGSDVDISAIPDLQLLSKKYYQIKKGDTVANNSDRFSLIFSLLILKFFKTKRI